MPVRLSIGFLLVPPWGLVLEPTRSIWEPLATMLCWPARIASHPNLDSFREDDKPATILSSFRRGGIDH